MECRQWGAHLPHVAGVSGQSDYGEPSVELSGDMKMMRIMESGHTKKNDLLLHLSKEYGMMGFKGLENAGGNLEFK
ncbi:E3 ubiquitin-protein ligase ORTHRUS 2 [Artemisia annua]|uniref:E3 ubiquitin-protein ligase ORTHRUS 2 n=1 Tax=Artemisia annua TaxID=35608 RepID=A0A2U1Q7B1_ARTAN|nr:E3 ubiquitin-protein ligase ORTHRUS 2 [Artemisia annua]